MSNHNKYKFQKQKERKFCFGCTKKIKVLIPSIENICENCLTAKDTYMINAYSYNMGISEDLALGNSFLSKVIDTDTRLIDTDTFINPTNQLKT